MGTLALHRSNLPFWSATALAVVAWLVAWFAAWPAPRPKWSRSPTTPRLPRVVLNTLGLVIDGEVKSTGRIPTPGDIAEWLTAADHLHRWARD